jgi:hypothetical protein
MKNKLPEIFESEILQNYHNLQQVICILSQDNLDKVKRTIGVDIRLLKHKIEVGFLSAEITTILNSVRKNPKDFYISKRLNDIEFL